MKYSIILLSILLFTNTLILSQIQHEVEGDTYINGKLGIKQNTVDASAILDIQSTSEGLLIPRMTSSQRLAIPNPAEGLVVYELTTSNFWFYDGTVWVEMMIGGSGGSSLWSQNGSNIFYNTGNVGVGIVSPPGKFSVSDPNRNAITIKTGNNLLDNGIAFQNGGDAYSWNIFRSNAGNNDAHLIFAGGDSSSDINLLPERMRIRNNGNVGIGTNLPITELHVAGNGALFRLEGSTHGFMEFYPEGTAVGRKAWVGYGSAASNDIFVINNQADGDMQFRTNSTLRMTITKDGDVGVGTSNPNGYKLAVNGNMGAEEIEVRANYWADYVFKEDYNLLSLEEVEIFINDNGHLPDVPAEEDAINKPLNLAEMDILLLQKIEELTLYTLQQEKIIKDQNNALMLLQERVAKLEEEK